MTEQKSIFADEELPNDLPIFVTAICLHEIFGVPGKEALEKAIARNQL